MSPFLIGMFVLLVFACLSSSWTLDANPLPVAQLVKISSHYVVCLFARTMVSSSAQNFLASWGPICQLLLLMSTLLWKVFSCASQLINIPCFLSDPDYQGWWYWVLYRVKNKDLVSIFCMQLFSLTSLMEDAIFSQCIVLAPLQKKSNGCRRLYMGPQFYSMGQHVFLCQ